jgi:hypothetical protein
MGLSSKMFLKMQAEDMEVMYDHNFTKKDAEATGIKLASDIFEKGAVSTIKVFSNIVKLKAVIDAAEKVFRERIVIGNSDTYNGVSFTNKSGAERLKYSEDWKVAELEDALKQRKELVKVATKSKDAIYDSEGIEVGKVGSEFTKDSIVITF